MKKLLGIMVLGLLWCNVTFAAETIVKLPKDTSSGYRKMLKSLTGKYYKDYGAQVVNKNEGHPVRTGNQSIRFEVRSGDCGRQIDGSWSDCKNDRERHELAAWKKGDIMSKGEYWFSWSIYFPKDHINLFPLSNAYGQFHQMHSHPVFMFKELRDGYSIVRTIGEGDEDYNEKKLVDNKDMPGNWIDIIINVKWSKKDEGFFKVWVNDELKYDYKGPTKTASHTYQKFGIYRTGLTRYFNYKNLDVIEKCLEKKGWPDQTKKTYVKFKEKKEPNHKRSIKLYKVCKDFYKPVNVPTTVIYFDEVRKTKECEKLRLEDLGYNCSDLKNQKMSKIDTENSASEEDESSSKEENKVKNSKIYLAIVKNKNDDKYLVKAEAETKELAIKKGLMKCKQQNPDLTGSGNTGCYVHYSAIKSKY
jgi:hypothetical protein